MLAIDEVWRRYDDVESRVTAPVSERMLDLAGLAPGMRVLDLASGRGEPALRAARRVGRHGHVLCIEPSAEMLRICSEKADREGVSNLDLRVASAERLEDVPPASFHAATVRWGLMYMAEPIAALASARRALMSTGVLVAALWAEPERVPYYTLPRRLLARHRPMPPVDPEAPGTFRYADLERIGRDFERAGFALDYVEEIEIPVFEAETHAELIAWVRALGLEPLLRELPEDEQRAWENELASEVERSRTDGRIRLGGVTRIVRARVV